MTYLSEPATTDEASALADQGGQSAAAANAALPAGTRFRDIAIGMTSAQVRSNLDPSFSIAMRYGRMRFELAGTECGAAELENDVVASLHFDKCYFGADNMPVRAFAQAIADNYAMGALEWEFPCRKAYDAVLFTDSVLWYGCFVGTTANNELVIIDEVGLDVKPPRGIPTFD